jgi:uncharacterized RDD family membrane protein YckC
MGAGQGGNVSAAGAPAGWYPDPAGSGGQRYFDGANWTGHLTAPPGYAPAGYGTPPVWRYAWKGAQYGRPAFGPGALASPGARLGAVCLDFLVLVPVFLLIAGVAIAIVAPHAGPIFPKTTVCDNGTGYNGAGCTDTGPPPGIVWIYLTVIGAMFVTGIVWFFYEAIAVAHYGRTLGMSWLKIRPVRIDGSPLSGGRAFGRAALFYLALFLGWIGLLDFLWCLWDENRRCLHDKAIDSLVIVDGVTAHAPSVGGWPVNPSPPPAAAPPPPPPPSSTGE